jgi:putative glutamine amidotransferase
MAQSPRIMYNGVAIDNSPMEINEVIARYTEMTTTEKEKIKSVKVSKKAKKTVGVAYGAFFSCIKEFIPDAYLIRQNTDILKTDLLIFTGGEDVDPAFYGELNTRSNGVNQRRDQIESNYFSIADDRNKKIVGFCRGHQLINVMKGGSLYQDYPSAGFDYHPGMHPLEIMTPNSVIDRFFSGKKIVSAHHQSVKNIGRDLIATSRYANTIESLESSNIITTQFHPEFESLQDQHVVDFFKFLVEEW